MLDEKNDINGGSDSTLDNYEIEIKLPVHNPEEIKAGLFRAGFKEAANICESDMYYNSAYHDVRKLFKLCLFGIQKINIDVFFAGCFIHPEIQGIDGEGDFVQLLADKCKILDLIIGDLSIPRDLYQAAGERIDLIQAGDGL